MTKWIAVGAVAIGISLAVWSMQKLQVAERNAVAVEQAWAKKEADLLTKIRELESAVGEREPLETAAPAAAAPKPQPVKISVDDPVSRADLVRQINERSEALASREAAMSELQGKLREEESQVASLREELEKAVAAGKAAMEKAEASAKALEAARSESEIREGRLSKLDASNLELKRRSDEAARKAARLSKLLDDLEDTVRREDVYLNNILRRYREVSDIYRTLAVRLENPRDGPPSANSDLSRIQNAISLADEDLRQLRSLQAQAAKIQKEVAAARKQ
ncbi:MAG: hypothetical protein JNL98_33465 [Bryobacterales bacterium]|nr:hypothetical protein [Bryobacterales bacterium]